MNAQVLAKGLKAIGQTVPVAVQKQLLEFADELLKWNRKINLTAITKMDEVIEKHLVDSLTLLPFVQKEDRLLDIGSGGGFPVLPLKITRPEIEAVSVDAVEKKLLFQRHIARLMKMEKFETRHGRLEDLAKEESLKGRFTVVVSRALSDLATCIDWSKPFLAEGGRMIAMKGKEGEREWTAIEKEGIRGVRLQQLEKITLPFSGSTRHLLVLKKDE